MATTTSNGLKKPADGDTGATFFDDCNTTIQLVNDHTHDGANSEGIVKIHSLPHGGGSNNGGSNTAWADDGTSTGTYYMDVTMPTKTVPTSLVSRVMQVSSHSIHFKNSNGETLYLSFTKSGATQYRVFSNDSSLDVTAYYI